MARSSPGVQRVAAILNFIVDHPGQAFTLTDLVRALKLSRATCHALLTGLVEVGYLYRASDKNYMLGPALVAIGKIALEHASPLQVAQPEMRVLADEFDTMCAAYFEPAQRVTGRRLDLDDVGAHVGEDAAGRGHKGPHRDLDDLDPRQRPFVFFRCHGSSPAQRRVPSTRAA